jgi:hypothetical protein
VALRQIAVPDINTGSMYNPALGPNEIVNLPIADQDYVRAYYSGKLHLTLVHPDVAGYVPGEKIAWNPGAARPAGKAAGNGAWDHAAAGLAGTDIFECTNWRPYGSPVRACSRCATSARTSSPSTPPDLTTFHQQQTEQEQSPRWTP